MDVKTPPAQTTRNDVKTPPAPPRVDIGEKSKSKSDADEGIEYDSKDIINMPKHSLKTAGMIPGLLKKKGHQQSLYPDLSRLNEQEASDSSSEESEKEEGSWSMKILKNSKNPTEKKNKKHPNADKQPPMIDLESLGKPNGPKYNSKQEEAEANFKGSKHWLGVKMTSNDIRKFVWCDSKHESDYTLINVDIYDENRKEAISAKVEVDLWINCRQVTIDQ